MAVCGVCRKKKSGRLGQRLAIPEYRAMTGYWPWVEIPVCEECAAAHDRDFRERLGLLAPQVLENDEPVVGRVCLACGAVDEDKAWPEASKWIDMAGRPTLRARFYLCEAHRDEAYIDGIVVSTNLADTARMAAVMGELPTVTSEMLARVEGWRPEDGSVPPGSVDFMGGRTPAEALAAGMAFWQACPSGVLARAAWLGPVRRDYRLRYRLDLMRDYAGGRRETFTMVRTGPEKMATYRTVRESLST
jgi:hypothetical protein